jgi:hypothetical protein
VAPAKRKNGYVNVDTSGSLKFAKERKQEEDAQGAQEKSLRQGRTTWLLNIRESQMKLVAGIRRKFLECQIRF